MKVRILSPIFGLPAGSEVYAEPLDGMLMGDPQTARAASLYNQQGEMVGLAHESRYIEVRSLPTSVGRYNSWPELLEAYVPAQAPGAHRRPTLATHPVVVQVWPTEQGVGTAYLVGPFEGVRQAENWITVAQCQMPWLGTLDVKQVAPMAATGAPALLAAPLA